MRNEWIYGFATSIRERILLLKDHYKNSDTSPYILAWRKRKTLVSDEKFQLMLDNYKITEEEFGIGIKSLTENDLKILFEYVSTQNWFIRHQELFNLIAPMSYNGIESSLRFHIAFVDKTLQNYLSENTGLQLSSCALNAILDSVKEELLLIAQRTLVWDVHETKKRINTPCYDKEEELIKYQYIRFSSPEKTKLFFSEYPTLSRLLSERVQFYVDNIIFFFNSILSSANKLSDTFSLNMPFHIQRFHFSNGDSHNSGKRPIIFTVNGVKLVYKFHSADNLLSYNEFLTYIDSFIDFNLYKVTCISNKNYSFEEFVTYTTCSNETDITIFYRNYGYLTALFHFLGTTDIHMENIIAHYSSPVLIDTETLLGVEERRSSSSNYTKNSYAETNSVILSGLLPMQKYWKRQLDVSALNGSMQKIPYKVRKLKNEKRSDIIYHLEEVYLTPAQNVPMLMNKKITYENYTQIIEDGYLKMISLLKQHTYSIFLKLNELFCNKKIRVLLRDTQDYENFITFSTHPSCMVDYIEREKIFENLWEHSFINNNIVELEIDALLKHDIPYFFTETSSLNIQSEHSTIESFFSISTIDKLYTHITSLSLKRIRLSQLLLKESINTLNFKEQNFMIKNRNPDVKSNLLRYAANIGDQIIETLILNEKQGFAIWPYLLKDETNSISITYPDNNLYNGTSGLFIFFSILNEIFPKPSYKYTLCILEKELLSDTYLDAEYHSAYWGIGVNISISYLLYHFTKDKKHLESLKIHLNMLRKNQKLISSVEWLYGSSSIISLLVTIYKDLGLDIANDILLDLISDFSIPNTCYPGFAHGYSGMLYALTKAEIILPINTIRKLNDTLFSLTLSKLQEQDLSLTNSWCNGTTGINRAIHAYCKLRNIPPVNTVAKFNVTESCLCHGTFGVFSCIIEKYQNSIITYAQYLNNVKQLLEEPLVAKSDKLIIPIDLFTGLAGIGYQLLHIMFPNDILDILFF